MTHPMRNPVVHQPASHDVRRVASLLLFLLAVLVPSPAVADKPAASPFASSPARGARDLELEAKIYRALRKDAQLKKANLNVRVSNGVVTLSGPVASQELKRRAIHILDGVEGVLSVRANGVYVTSPHAAQPAIVIPLEEPPTQTRAASPGSTPLDARTPFTPLPAPRPSATYRPAEPDREITLLAPVAPPRPTRTPEPARLTANPRPAPSLALALEALRQSNVRFQGIRTQISEETVYLYPGDAPADEVMTFAQAVRRLAGVQHVVVAPPSR
jgi:hypothetical protein